MTHDEKIQLFREAFASLDKVQSLLLEARANHEAEAARRAAEKSDDKTAIEYLKQLRDKYEQKQKSEPEPMWPWRPDPHTAPRWQPNPYQPGTYCNTGVGHHTS